MPDMGWHGHLPRHSGQQVVAQRCELTLAGIPCTDVSWKACRQGWIAAVLGEKKKTK